MARLDRFIQVMHEHRSEGLPLATGRPVSLLSKDVARPLTRDPPSDAQILGPVRQIAPPNVSPLVTATAQISFACHPPSGSINVELQPASSRSVRSGRTRVVSGRRPTLRCARIPMWCWWARCGSGRRCPSPSRRRRPVSWSSARCTPPPPRPPSKEAYVKAVEKSGFAAALKPRRHDISFLGDG